MSHQLATSVHKHTCAWTQLDHESCECMKSLASCAYCNLSRWTKSTGLLLYQRSMQGDECLNAVTTLLRLLCSPQTHCHHMTLEENCHSATHFSFVLFWWAQRHEVENDWNSVKSQIKDKSKRQIEIPTAKKEQSCRENVQYQQLEGLLDRCKIFFSCSVGCFVCKQGTHTNPNKVEWEWHGLLLFLFQTEHVCSVCITIP